MKTKLILILLIGACQILLASSYGYINKDIKNKDFTLLQGVKVKIIKNTKNKTKVMLKAYRNNKNELFYDKTFNLKIGFSSLSNTKKNKHKFLLKTEDISIDQEEVWEEYEELYFESCSQCHAAMEAKEHSMLEWEGIFDSMKEQAQFDEEEEQKILYYLKSHANDGFIKYKE